MPCHKNPTSNVRLLPALVLCVCGNISAQYTQGMPPQPAATNERTGVSAGQLLATKGPKAKFTMKPQMATVAVLTNARRRDFIHREDRVLSYIKATVPGLLQNNSHQLGSYSSIPLRYWILKVTKVWTFPPDRKDRNPPLKFLNQDSQADFETHPSISRSCWFPKHLFFWLPVDRQLCKIALALGCFLWDHRQWKWQVSLT